MSQSEDEETDKVKALQLIQDAQDQAFRRIGNDRILIYPRDFERSVDK